MLNFLHLVNDALNETTYRELASNGEYDNAQALYLQAFAVAHAKMQCFLCNKYNITDSEYKNVYATFDAYTVDEDITYQDFYNILDSNIAKGIKPC